MAAQYKQKCARCKKNYVLATSRSSYIICYECQKGSISEEITDPAFKDLFDIPEEFYKENAFLRNIKAYYLKNKTISANQEAAFIKAVEKMKAEKK